MTQSSIDIGEQETQFFYELTPERVLSAVEACGERCTGRVLALNSMENRVYEVEIEHDQESIQSRYDGFRVVKFYRPGRWSQEQILDEHRFLQALTAKDVSVAPPIQLNNGQTVQKADGLDIWFAVFPKVGGRNLDELSDEQLERLGFALARLHSVGASFSLQGRRSLDPDTFGREALAELERRECLPEEVRPIFADLVNQICDASDPLFSGQAQQSIHGDCHVGNLLWSDSGCTFVDFDDTINGPCVQDIWLLLPGRDEDSYLRREKLLAAYEQLRVFERNSLGLVEPLRALRMIHFSAWIARRWSDPAFQRVFPDFGSGQYWREQLVALQECLQLMRGVGWEGA